jgi:hypothetical protein
MVRIASLAAAAAIGAGISLAGCAMHDGMLGRSHGPARIATASVHEVQRDEVRIRFEAPPLAVGEMAMLRLHVAAAAAPRRGGGPTATIRPEGDRSVHEETPGTPAAYVFAEQERPGDYVLGHLFEAAGSYRVNVGVALTGSGSSPVQFSSVLQVAEGSSGQHHAHRSSLVVLAGVGMALMMLLGMAVF